MSVTEVAFYISMHTQLTIHWIALYESAFIFLTQYYVYAEKKYCGVKLDKQISFNHIVQMQVYEFRKDPV